MESIKLPYIIYFCFLCSVFSKNFLQKEIVILVFSTDLSSYCLAFNVITDIKRVYVWILWNKELERLMNFKNWSSGLFPRGYWCIYLSDSLIHKLSKFLWYLIWFFSRNNWQLWKVLFCGFVPIYFHQISYNVRHPNKDMSSGTFHSVTPPVEVQQNQEFTWVSLHKENETAPKGSHFSPIQSPDKLDVCSV